MKVSSSTLHALKDKGALKLAKHDWRARIYEPVVEKADLPPLPQEREESATWYRLGRDTLEISPVEVERATASSVYIRGRRHAKETEYAIYYPTYDLAKEQAIWKAERSLENAQSAVERAQKMLKRVRAMQQN